MPASKLDENTPASLTVSLNGQSVHFGQTIQPQKKWTLFLVPESPYYRVKLDPSSGAVRSIYDKQLQKELVDEKSSYRFGQYLYVAGGDKEPNSILQYRVVSPKPDLQIHAAQGHLVSVEPTVYGWRAPLESSAENTSMIASEIRLFENEKKIEFIQDVTKKEVISKEGVYFAFPFAMSHSQFQYEIQNGVVDPSKDMYPGAGHEWFSAQHWSSVQQDGMTPGSSLAHLGSPINTFPYFKYWRNVCICANNQ